MPNNTGIERDALAHRLQRAVFRLGRELRAANEDASMSSADLVLLAAIRLQPGAGVSELARAERVGRSVVSEQATRLETAGLVRRDGDAEDGRRVGLSLTDAGRAAFALAARRRELWLEARLQKLTKAERRVLAVAIAVLDRLTDQESHVSNKKAGGTP